MIKVFKRKNPNLQGKEYIDDTFVNLLFESIIYNDPEKFKWALTYKNIGNDPCTDCSDEHKNRFYINCTCENFLDDYDIDFRRGDHTKQNLIDAVKKQFKYLSFPQLIKFRTNLINIDYSNKADTAFYVSPKSIRIYRDDAKDIIREINNVISKRR